MHITLRPNEKIYINGAVLKADRKVSIELLNDAVFLLESHVMQEGNATTPIKQLYYMVQIMLMERNEQDANRLTLLQHCSAMARQYTDGQILEGVAKVLDLVGRKRYFEALKVIRSLVPVEHALIEAVPLAAAS